MTTGCQFCLNPEAPVCPECMADEEYWIDLVRTVCQIVLHDEAMARIRETSGRVKKQEE